DVEPLTERRRVRSRQEAPLTGRRDSGSGFQVRVDVGNHLVGQLLLGVGRHDAPGLPNRALELLPCQPPAAGQVGAEGALAALLTMAVVAARPLVPCDVSG